MLVRLGLPKGSLQDATFDLFQKAGYNLRVASRSYHPVIDDPEIEPVLLRPQEIPRYIEDGVIDAGLTGHDWITDCDANLAELAELPYSKLTSNPIRIVLAVHNDSNYQKAEDLANKTIATEYQSLTNRYFQQKGVNAKIEFSWGACEVKVPDLVEAIVVNTETGSSLRAHNLRIIDTLLTSTTRFVANHQALADHAKKEKLENLAILLTGAINASNLVGLKMNVLQSEVEAVKAILPSLKNPTISPLADGASVALEVILSEKESRHLIPALKRAGATGIVEYPLNKVIY